METYQIVWSIVGLIILIVGLILAIIFDDKDKSYNLLSFILAYAGTTLILVFDDSYKQGQIDALKGNYKYKMEIRYELKDSTYYTPKDTIYVKIK